MSAVAHSKCSDCPVGKHGICAGLGPQTRRQMVRHALLQDYRANQLVWNEESPPSFVGIVVSGYLRVQRHGIDGRRQILSLLMRDDLVGGLCGRSLKYTVEASTDARICRIDRRVFERLMDDDPVLRNEVYQLQLAKLEQLRWLTWSLGGLNAKERLCSFLAMATNHMSYRPHPGGGGILTLDLPRADIADLLGTSVESISRITRRLAAEGVIDIRSTRHFHIPDLNRLIRMGCLEGSFGNIRFPTDLRQVASRQPDKTDAAA